MKYILIAFLGLTIISCNMQKKTVDKEMTQQSKIENTRWSLIEFDGKPVPSSVAGLVHIYLSDEDNSINGSNGCNHMMGSYEITNHLQINFSNIATTMMACNNESWNDNQFNEMLETANNYNIVGNKLFLNIGKRAPLAVFVKLDEEGITNKYWKLVQLDGKEVTMSDSQEREQFFIMREDGTFNGFSGCNDFSGKYLLESETLRVNFKQVISTLKACPDMEIDETAFLDVFQQANNFTINDDTLMLNVGKRAPLAVFEAIYF